MKAIYVKYLGPTDKRGSRCKATDNDGNTVIVGWRCDLDAIGNGVEAVKALVNKMGWNNLWVTNGDVAVAVAKSETPEVITDWDAIERFSPVAKAQSAFDRENEYPVEDVEL